MSSTYKFVDSEQNRKEHDEWIKTLPKLDKSAQVQVVMVQKKKEPKK